jgi:hypothetical protein
MDNERGIARASQAEWVEVVLATDGLERAEESPRFVCPWVLKLHDIRVRHRVGA